MKKICFIILTLMLFCPFMINAEELEIEWERSWGGDSKDEFTSSLVTEDGEIIVVGYTTSPEIDGLKYNGGYYDAVIVKYDKDGNMLWQKNWGGNGNDYFYEAIETSNGEIIVAGSSKSTDIEGLPNKGKNDAIIVKYDKDGNLIWQKSWGGNNNDEFYELLQTEDGGFIAYVNSASTDIEGLPNKGDKDAIIVKYDKDGNILWQKSWGGNKDDYFYNILQITEGEFVAVGYSYSTDIDGLPNKGVYGSNDAIIVKYDKDGNMLWQMNWGGNGSDYFNNIIETNDDNLVAIGGFRSTNIEGLLNKGEVDAVIVKFDKDGKVLWQKSWGGNYSDGFQFALSTNDGSIVVTGQFESHDIDGIVNESERDAAIIIKYNKDGNMLWYDYIGNGRSLKFSSMIITKDNEIIATRDAYWEEEGIFYIDDDDALIIKYDKDGNRNWEKSWGGNKSDIFYKIILTNDNSIIATGMTYSDDIEGITNKGERDIVIVKYSYKFNLETLTNDNGNLKVEQQGSQAIITPTPVQGYEVDQIIIKDKNGEVLDLEVTRLEDGTYSFDFFTDVSVELTFKEKIENPKTGILDVMTILIIGFIMSVTGIFIVKNYNERYEI